MKSFLKIIFITFLLFACSNNTSTSYEIENDCADPKAIFPGELKDGIYIALPSKGCVGCIQKTLMFLDSTKRKDINICLYDSAFSKKLRKFKPIYVPITAAQKSGFIPYFPYLWKIKDGKIVICSELSAQLADSVLKKADK